MLAFVGVVSATASWGLSIGSSSPLASAWEHSTFWQNEYDLSPPQTVLIFANYHNIVRRGDGEDMFADDEYEDESSKAYVELPGQSTPAPAANVSPEMADAMAKFPQWSQEEIQGYFDQGWSVQALQDWVNEQ